MRPFVVSQVLGDVLNGSSSPVLLGRPPQGNNIWAIGNHVVVTLRGIVG